LEAKMAKEKVIKLHDFENHKNGCNLCAKVNIEKPPTLANCCIVGAPLLRDYLVHIASPEYKRQVKALKHQYQVNGEGKNFKTTKKKLAEVMVYK